MNERIFLVKSLGGSKGESKVLSKYYTEYNTFKIVFLKDSSVCLQYIYNPKLFTLLQFWYFIIGLLRTSPHTTYGEVDRALSLDLSFPHSI